MTILEVLPSHEYLSCTFQTKEQFLFTDKLAKTDTATELLLSTMAAMWKKKKSCCCHQRWCCSDLALIAKPVQNPFTDKLKIKVMVIRRLAIKLKTVHNLKTSSHICVRYWWSHNSLKYEGRIYFKVTDVNVNKRLNKSEYWNVHRFNDVIKRIYLRHASLP